MKNTYLAYKAREKLFLEASRPNHNLRVLVGHANLLDHFVLLLTQKKYVN